ncbi:MAG: acyl-CoA dehydratase activase-related protein, partial [Actinomycetes bacterium]|nr:acyl-CoA dehydratase activase-related protein [Actinomycetes bacterium]
MQPEIYVGIDVGSTTVKALALDGDGQRVIHAEYTRHHSDVRATVAELLRRADEAVGERPARTVITGSGGLLLSKWLDVPFEQEVIASKAAVTALIPATDVAIELGGEDAKIIYFDRGIEQRMNGSCAGGTGAFIDQMAVLMDTDPAGLDALAQEYQTLHPIASRCGVFAKTDIQPLLNEGARREDVAASIFQAVVTQTIAGLACGRPIRGKVAFLGGPLQYLPQLRRRFIETLKLTDDEIIVPDDAHLFVAHGAALLAAETASGQRSSAPSSLAAQHQPSGTIPDSSMQLQPPAITLKDLRQKLLDLGDTQAGEITRLPPLFADEDEYRQFCDRHAALRIGEVSLSDYTGPAWLGIDAGSTTLKMALIGAGGQLLWSRYGFNGGDVLAAAREGLGELYRTLPDDGSVWLARTTTTGYGEGLLQCALVADEGEVETIAHLRAARQLCPDVDFVLDIGGQDMKSFKLAAGVIDQLMLNEACSSGCGSFIASFASSLGLSSEDFASHALYAAAPVDLGNRCTVFMNSRVKQAQKEGATVGDIAAGLSYSVIKNALYKVIKIRDLDDLGRHIVVQGGTFLNDAVLRAFELLLGRQVMRPAQAGLMGAYGAALLARDASVRGGSNDGSEYVHPRSTLLDSAGVAALEPRRSQTRCRGCSNACPLTISDFGTDAATGRRRRFVTGNRCEKGASKTARSADIPNLYAWKLQRLFDYPALPADKAWRGTVGLPRALNLYENYPFWHTFFTYLGYRVVLSDPSTKATFEEGIESMPSESVCYPAKLAHGHIENLLRKDIDFIFMPCIVYERKEDPGAQNQFNCPVVISYSEALRLNVDDLNGSRTQFLNPFIPYHKRKQLSGRLLHELAATAPDDRPLTQPEVRAAVDAAWEADERYKADLSAQGDAALAWLQQHATGPTPAHGIVLAGRPYHVDPEINHAIPELLTSMGLAVLTEDSVAHLAHVERPLRVVDQWMYHSRLYRAAKLVTQRDDLDLVQLNSFGCGLDALTCDQTQEILEGAGKIYTCLKIDEISNLGAIRVRLRSLLSAIKGQDRKSTVTPPAPTNGNTPDDGRTHSAPPSPIPSPSTAFPRTQFTADMKRAGYTILAPQMAPIHFRLLEPLFAAHGYHINLLPSVDAGAVDAGLRFVNNDICYPSILVTGQIMEAVLSGRYDTNRLAVIITQTGGCCRATNYIALIRKALREANLGHIPVISLSFVPLGDTHPGFQLSLPMLTRAVQALVIGDALMAGLYRTRPYETSPGSADALFETLMSECVQTITTLSWAQYRRLVRRIVSAFDTLPLTDDRSKPRVGVVGEILVKFHPTANNELVKLLEAEDCEVVVPGLVDFFLYSISGGINQYKPVARGFWNMLAMRA